MADCDEPTRLDLDGLNAILDHAVDVIVGVDSAGACRYVSAGATRMFGYPVRTLVGRQLLDIVHPDDRDAAVAALADVLADGPDYEPQVYRIRRADGSFLPVDVLAERLPANSAAGHVVLTVRDATTRVEMEQALRHRLEFEVVLDRLASSFIETPPGALDETIRRALGDIGGFLEVDRVCLYHADHMAEVAVLTHEWCRTGIASWQARVPIVRFADHPHLVERLRAMEIVEVDDLQDLGPEWDRDRAVLDDAAARALVSIPLTVVGQWQGTLTLAQVTHTRVWNEEELAVARTVALLFAHVLGRRQAEAEMALTLEQLRHTTQDVPVALALADHNGRYVQVNRALCRLLGYSEAELLGMTWVSVTHPDDRAGNAEVFNELRDHPTGTTTHEKRYVRADGSVIWARVDLHDVRSPDGRFLYSAAHIQDITERKQAEAALAASERRFRTLVDNIPDPILRLDPNGEAVFANSAAQGLIAPGDSAELLRRWHHAADEIVRTGAGQVMEFEVDTPGGPRWFQSHLVPEIDESGKVGSLLAVSRDLTERRRYEAELSHQAQHDPLTGLPNRGLFLTHLEQAVTRLARSDRGLAVLFLDLDRFKVVNDSLGHAAGDDMLVAVASRIRSALRPQDVVARLGGDEFTVLLEGLADATEAVHTGERLQRALASPIEIAGQEVFTGTSIGIAIAHDRYADPFELLRHADAAMYRAKDRGRARCEVFDEQLHAVVSERLRLESALRHAMARGELMVHYQPEVDLRTGAMVGVEALARWQHPERGLLSAEAFIALAEETGMIVSIGRMVLDEALRQTATWLGLVGDRPFTMRVNLSARQLNQPDLAKVVGELLAKHAVDPTHVCLEITETALMDDAEAGLAILRELHGLGVQLAIDDFGTGYSSLSYLKRFPVQVLKIDRSFVDGLPHDSDDLAIVTTIVRLAETLGLTVTAEGIETRAQVDALRRLGCNSGQGFLFARPAPPDAIDVLLGFAGVAS